MRKFASLILLVITFALISSAGCALEGPYDPRYGKQWGLQAINAPEAWKTTTGDSDVYVVVVDGGVDYDHPDLHIANEYCRGFTSTGQQDDYRDNPDGHGTLVAGIIGARGNELGIVGVGWHTKIIALKNNNSITATVRALNYVREELIGKQHLKIASVNLSIGYKSSNQPVQVAAVADATLG